MTCDTCKREHDRQGESTCLMCAVLMAEAGIAREEEQAMTRDEFVDRWGWHVSGSAPKAFRADLDALLRAERERCAEEADGLHEHYAEMRHEAGDIAPAEWSRACKYVAERIRSLT